MPSFQVGHTSFVEQPAQGRQAGASLLEERAQSRTSNEGLLEERQTGALAAARRAVFCLSWAPSYDVAEFLPGDAQAGVTVGIVLIAQGVA